MLLRELNVGNFQLSHHLEEPISFDSCFLVLHMISQNSYVLLPGKIYYVQDSLENKAEIMIPRFLILKFQRGNFSDNTSSDSCLCKPASIQISNPRPHPQPRVQKSSPGHSSSLPRIWLSKFHPTHN